MSRRKLKIAIAGAGMISRHHLIAWQRIANDVVVVAVCDPDAARAAERAREFAIPRTYDSLATLLACEDSRTPSTSQVRERRTRNGSRPRQIARYRCSARSRYVRHCPKQRILFVRWEPARVSWFMRIGEFRPWYREARRWLDAGAIGDLLMARMTLLSSAMLPDGSGRSPAFVRQLFMTGEERLMIAEVLIHHLDVMRYLCGPLRLLAARTVRSLAEAKGETFAAMFLETVDGSPVEVTGTMAAPGLPARTCDRLELIGSKASLIFDDWTLSILGRVPRRTAFDADEGYQASFDATIAHFITGLRTGAAFETEAADNIETLRLVEHAYWSASQSRPLGNTRRPAP